jgi:hypothetical protein
MGADDTRAEFSKREHLRQIDRDPEVNECDGGRQIEAIGKRGIQREGSYDYAIWN